MKLRALTYNIHRAIGVDRRFRPDRIREILAHYDADVVLLQEVDDGAPRSREMDLARDLAGILDYPHYAVGHNVRLRRGRYGNATLSRYPIVRERNILTTGYNGAPAGLPHCTEVGCLVYESKTPTGEIEENCYRTIHAEINAIAQAAKNGTNIRGADIYVTHTPCIHCLKVLINTDIRRVFYEKAYKIHTLHELLASSQVELQQIEFSEPQA